MTLYQKIAGLFKTKRDEVVESSLQRKYKSYRELLTCNTLSLNALSDLELMLRGPKPFTIEQVRASIQALVGFIRQIVEHLNGLCGDKYLELFAVVETMGRGLSGQLDQERSFRIMDLVLPLAVLDRGLARDVGGKAANFGEIANRVGLPVPPGFAVTARACALFMEHGGLADLAAGLLRDLAIDDLIRLDQVSAEMQGKIKSAELPAELEKAIGEQVLALGLGPNARLSVRSSATGEDSEASFAGQYASVLGVPGPGVPRAYKEVVASTFTPRAISYRRNKGYGDSDILMSVLCLAMVEAVCSGVMYTVDPTDHTREDIIISAAWGLGVSVVDGLAPVDVYRLDKTPTAIKDREVVRKVGRVVMAGQGLRQEPVPAGMSQAPCLADQDILLLARYGLALEGHYGRPLDIEWAKDQAGRILILQARPLNPLKAEAGDSDHQPDLALAQAGTQALLRGGHCACPGVVAAPCHVLASDKDLADVPDGAILVAPQTSPAFVSIMGRLTGIITDYGSITGHMSAVAREFELPALVATEHATKVLSSGQELTLDASRRAVYPGRVECLLRAKRQANPMEGGPVYALARQAMRAVGPLTLTDPHAPNFTPKGCQTLHDIIRLAHEISMREMFTIGDSFEDHGGAVRLRVHLPVIIHCVDLGGGLSMTLGQGAATQEDVACQPFRALLRGMKHKDVRWTGGVEMSMSGVAALMAHSLLNDPTVDGRFGGPSYAVISKEYLNFNARLGYHFAVVDSYCGPVVDENYLAFSFKGGAADLERRLRRVKLIAVILEELGLSVERKGDMIQGKLKEGKSAHLCEKLDYLGRLLGSVRLLDMAIADDSQIPWYAEEFFKGNYSFGRT